MKKRNAVRALLAALPCALFAAGFETKGNVTLGVTPVARAGAEAEFGGAYLLGNIAVSNERLTAAGKIYYRLGATDDIETLSQKIDVKRAFVRFRPFGNGALEFSGGKLYSYYLSGNYFQLAEIYTGASRWGKTGVGARARVSGLTLGLALPLSESYAAFSEEFALNAAAEFDFSSVAESVPLTAGASLLYGWTKGADDEHDFQKTVSLTCAPAIDGFISLLSLTLSYTHNAEPFVANATYKNVANCGRPDLKKAQFASLTFRAHLGEVQLLAEGEAGRSIGGELVPLYAAAQALVPVAAHVALKPRVCYYAALDTDDGDMSRHAFEFYPRAWLTFARWTVSAGVDLGWKQAAPDDWQLEWSLPLYVEYKIGK